MENIQIKEQKAGLLRNDKCRKVADIKIGEGAGIKKFSVRFCFMATGNNVAVTVSVTQGNC